MKRIILGSLVLVVIGLATGIAQAEFIDEPVKWSQQPDMSSETGMRVRAEHPQAWGGQIVADDWMCTDPNPVIAVRWWGSYYDTALEPTVASRHLGFEIVFHSDSPYVPGQTDFSTPLAVLTVPGAWQYVTAQEELYGVVEGSGNPTYNLYEYNAYLTVPLEQVEGTIYWIDIEYDEQANIGYDPGDTWAWQTTVAADAWNDKAVYGPTHTGPWEQVPCHHMAFELMVPVPGAVLLGILGLSVAGIKLRKYA